MANYAISLTNFQLLPLLKGLNLVAFDADPFNCCFNWAICLPCPVPQSTDEAALADLRLALSQGQPLGRDRFSDKICAAAGIRKMQKGRGRPAAKPEQLGDTETQNDFGF